MRYILLKRSMNAFCVGLSGMFTRLIQLDKFSGQHPIHGLPPLVEANPEMTFLEKSEIEKLLSVLVGDDLLVALLCLSTGGRCHTETSTDNKLQGYLFENQKRQKANRADF
ncbi:Puataive integrase [Salmonella enterica]|nr:Puataive integrase [Salmonella enterica]